MLPEERTGHMFKLIHNTMGSRMNMRLKDQELTFSQLRVLLYLSLREGKPVSVRDIEQRFSIAHPTAVGLIQRLESKGFLRVKVNSADRRMRDITLSEKGISLHDDMLREIDSCEELMLHGFTSEERAQLRSLLTRVYDNITNEETVND